MGVVQLPTYEAQEVEIGTKLPSRDAEFAAMGAAGQARRSALETGLDAITGFGKTIINKAMSDELTKSVTSYNEWSKNRLRELEEKPINPGDPEYEELSAEERASPNTAVFNKDRKKWLEENASKLYWPKTKKAFTQWLSERSISENDGLMRFDYVKSHEMALDTFQEAFLEATDAGQIKVAQDAADIALAADVITPKQYDDYLDLGYKDVSKSKAKLKALTMGDAGLAWIANADNTSYETYDGKKKMLPLNEQTALVKEFEILREEKAREQDTIFSDKFVRADTPEKINALELELIENPYMMGTQKRTWDSWIQDKKGRMLEGEVTSADVVSALYSRLYRAKDSGKINPGIEVTIEEIDRTVKDPKDHQAILAKRNELQKAYEEGGQSTREDIFYEAYRVANDPYMSEAAKNKWIDDHTRMGGGLSPEDGMKVRGWIKPYNDDPVRKEAMDAIGEAFRIAMSTETNYNDQMKIARNLYNAQEELDKMFRNPNTTKEQIRATVNRILEGRTVQTLMSELSKATGGAGFPVAGVKPGTARELETAREYGLFSRFPEEGYRYESEYRSEAVKLEIAALKNIGVTVVKQERNEEGDEIYFDASGAEYKVRMGKNVGKSKVTMVETVWKKEYRELNGKLQSRWVLVDKK